MAISKPSLSDASGKIIPSFTNWEIYVRAVAVLILKTLHNSEIVKYGFLISLFVYTCKPLSTHVN